MTKRSFGLLDDVAQVGWRATINLAFDDRRGSSGNKLIPLQNEFWINPVASGLIHFVATEVAVKFVFVVIVAAEFQTFAVWCKFAFFIKHHQLCCAPWLAWFANVTPELVIGFVIRPPDIIIAGRFSCDVLGHLDSRLLNALRNSCATREEQSAHTTFV